MRTIETALGGESGRAWLLRALRPGDAVEISITSSAGNVWPLRVVRRPDGKVEVSLLEES